VSRWRTYISHLVSSRSKWEMRANKMWYVRMSPAHSIWLTSHLSLAPRTNKMWLRKYHILLVLGASERCDVNQIEWAGDIRTYHMLLVLGASERCDVNQIEWADDIPRTNKMWYVRMSPAHSIWLTSHLSLAPRTNKMWYVRDVMFIRLSEQVTYVHITSC
jgi:hypothetical protein